MKLTSTLSVKIVQRIIALILLTAYAGAGTSVMPALALMLADLDGSHFAKVIQSNAGTEVLLDHVAEFTPNVDDHLSSLARMVTRLSKQTDEGSHLLTSKRLHTPTGHDTLDGLRHVKKSAEFNFGATLHLLATLQQTLSTAASVRLPILFQRVQPTHKVRNLETVQLLI